MSGDRKLLINKTAQLEKNRHVLFVQSVSMELHLCMVSEAELKWEYDIWSFDNIRKFAFNIMKSKFL